MASMILENSIDTVYVTSVCVYTKMTGRVVLGQDGNAAEPKFISVHVQHGGDRNKRVLGNHLAAGRQSVK